LADIELIKNEIKVNIPEQYQSMVSVLKKIFAHLSHPYVTLIRHYDDANWVGSRLTELLPLSLFIKQQLLEQNEPLRRLAMLYDEMLVMGVLSES
jgi:Lon protease-like protein